MSESRQFRELERAAATGRRSMLFLWMYRHHEEFTALIKRAGRPNWAELAAKFGEMGQTDRLGNTPQPEGARQTWVKVRKLLEREARESLRNPQSAAQPRDEFFPESGQAEGFVADNEFDDIERALGKKP